MSIDQINDPVRNDQTQSSAADSEIAQEPSGSPERNNRNSSEVSNERNKQAVEFAEIVLDVGHKIHEALLRTLKMGVGGLHSQSN